MEEFAARTEGARSVGDDKHGFRTGPLDDIQSNVAIGVHCMDSTGDGRNSIEVVLVAHPELATVVTEVARHYSWIFNVAGLIVMIKEEPDIGDSCQSVAVVQAAVPLNLPDATATFTRHEHVEVKSLNARLVERSPGMVPWIEAASVWD